MIAIGGTALLFVGAVFVADSVFPSNGDLLICNETDAEIFDVRLLNVGTRFQVVARFPRIAAHADELVEDPGFGMFSLEFADHRGRWTAADVRYMDADETWGSEPKRIVVTASHVESVALVKAR